MTAMSLNKERRPRNRKKPQTTCNRESEQPFEAKFARRVLDEVMKSYEIDPARIVAHGHEGGGALAYLLAFGNLDVVRGLAVVDAPLPSDRVPPGREANRNGFRRRNGTNLGRQELPRNGAASQQ